MTADDFKYSFERMLRVPLAPATYFYMGVVGAQAYYDKKADTVTGVKVLDRYTIEFDLESPDLSFLKAYGGMDFSDVVAKEWVAKWGKQFDRHPLGTGPFVFDHWTPGQQIVLKRNPTYWETGKPYLDELRYDLSFNPETAFMKLQRGEVDVLGDMLPTPDIPRVKANPLLSRNLYTMTKMGTQYLFLNTRLKPFDNLKVRQAMSWAINRDKLVKLLGGQAEPLYQVYPKPMPGYVEGKKYYGYDPAKAKALLAEAGYPNGFKTMLYTSNVDPLPKLMQSVQSDLADIGVRAGLKTLSDSTFNTLSGTPGAATMQHRLDDGLPRPLRLDHPVLQQEQRRRGRRRFGLLVEPQARADDRRRAGDDRRAGAHRQVHGDAGLRHGPGALRDPLPAGPGRHVLGCRGRVLSPSGVRVGHRQLLAQVTALAGREAT